MKDKQNNPNDYFKAKQIVDTLVNEPSEENCEKVREQINEMPLISALLEELSDEESLREKYREVESIRADKHRNVEALVNDIRRRGNRRRLVYYWSSGVVAAILLLSFLLILPSKQNSVANYTAVETIAKVENKEPILILSNGENVNLAQTGEVAIDGVVEVQKQTSTLIYGSAVSQEIPQVKFNTLIVPKMFTYTVSLADGTVVTLNANSELKYPTQFVGETREVYLSGEAFFQVKPSSKRFIVHVADVEVKVYGTEFNVCANNYNSVKTTLVSGSVGVSYVTSSGKANEVIIRPNQMAMVNLISEGVAVTEVDAEISRAWVDGYLRYYGDNLETILEKLSMWYGVDFYFENPKNKEVTLSVSFDNTTSLNEILSSIEQIIHVKFVKKGEKYVVI